MIGGRRGDCAAREREEGGTHITDRVSTLLSNIRGRQSGTWSVGQEKISGTSTELQQELVVCCCCCR